ncbi:MAG: hypothetical protein R2932_04595 [Caldilineaceae bacterium]
MSIQITFLDVGHGDCIVISQATTAVIVDVRSKRRLEKWLDHHDIKVIDCLYFTHGHQDHVPSLTNVVTFVEDWIKRKDTQVRRLCLPTEVIRTSAEKASSPNTSDIQRMRLQSALDKLELWYSQNTVEFLRGEKNPQPHSYEDLRVNILHPSFVYSERQRARNSNNLNETSVVLRIDYGSFRALLLGDLEGSGIASLLAHCDANELEANVLKIPHHGAWPSNGHELHHLLKTSNPEIAILSVGSKNQHGHVVPELFDALLNLKNDSSCRLDQFVCTEVTRTCVWDSIQRQQNRYANLDQQMPCAGDISIIAEHSGSWVRMASDQHAEVVDSISFPACRGTMNAHNV